MEHISGLKSWLQRSTERLFVSNIESVYFAFNHAWVSFDKKQRRGVVVLSTTRELSVEATKQPAGQFCSGCL